MVEVCGFGGSALRGRKISSDTMVDSVIIDIKAWHCKYLYYRLLLTD